MNVKVGPAKSQRSFGSPATTRVRRRILTVFARCVVPVALLAGCGITPDSEPRALPPDLTGPARDRNPENDPGNVPSSIFMQAGESRRLVPVSREVAALSVEDIAKATLVTVSYTHLTLPTSDLV